MKIATLAQSPVFGGKLKSVDDSEAQAVKGVRQVVRLDDAVAVVADHMGAAKKGLEALEIDWDDGPHAKLDTDDVATSSKQATLRAGRGGAEDRRRREAMAGAATKVEAIYQVPFLAHATMEPMNCTVHVRPDGCEIWVGTQAVARAQATAAKVTGLPLDKVVVHNHLIGGGFGRRLEVDGVTRAVQIAQQVDGPVKVVWTREEDIQHDMYRPVLLDRMSAGLDADGQPVAWNHRVAGSSIIARWLPPALQERPRSRRGRGRGRARLRASPTSRSTTCGPSRRASRPRSGAASVPRTTVFVVESFIDELAAAAKQDPVAYRRALLDKSPRAKAVLELAAAKAGWGQPLPKGAGRGVSVQSCSAAIWRRSPRSRSERWRGAACGASSALSIAASWSIPTRSRRRSRAASIFGITAALYGEITLKNGRVEQANFDTYQMLRINEVPAIEVHIVPSSEAPGGIGEPGTSASSRRSPTRSSLPPASGCGGCQSIRPC